MPDSATITITGDTYEEIDIEIVFDPEFNVDANRPPHLLAMWILRALEQKFEFISASVGDDEGNITPV